MNAISFTKLPHLYVFSIYAVCVSIVQHHSYIAMCYNYFYLHFVNKIIQALFLAVLCRLSSLMMVETDLIEPHPIIYCPPEEGDYIVTLLLLLRCFQRKGILRSYNITLRSSILILLQLFRLSIV